MKRYGYIYHKIYEMDNLRLAHKRASKDKSFYKEVKMISKNCDDLIILGSNKEWLHSIRKDVQNYLQDNLNLKIKNNYKIYHVDKQGIDFVGYRHFRNYILLRKTTANKLIRTMRDIKKKMDDGGKFNESDFGSINGYKGWLKWCDGYNLYKKWIEPLEPYAEKYYKEVIKSENTGKCKEYRRGYTCC